MEKVTCIMVTYNPSFETYETLKKLIEEEVFVILIDNGSKTNNITINIEKLLNDNKMFFHNFKINNGIAKAQNLGLKVAKEKKFEFVTFFDQDTIIPKNFVSEMLCIFKEYEKKFFPELGILAPNIIDKNTGEASKFAVLNERTYFHKRIEDNDFEEVSFVVSSGSFIKLSTIEKVGLLRDDFFIDQVDIEYCLRLLSNGYSIVVTSRVVINHTIGDRNLKKIFFLNLRPNNHNSTRKYYIFRNGLKTISLYKKEFKGLRYLIIMRLMHEFLGVILFEKSKKGKIYAIFKGINDSRKF